MDVFLRYYSSSAVTQTALGSRPHGYSDIPWKYPQSLLQTYVAYPNYDWFIGTVGDRPNTWFALTKAGYAEFPTKEAAVAYAELTL